MRRCLTPVFVAAAMTLSVPALADGKAKCPPGAWFCAEADVDVSPPALPAPQAPAAAVVTIAPVTPGAPQVAPAPRSQVVVVDEEPAAPPPPPVRQRRPPPPPVVIYQPVPSAPPQQIIIISPGYGYYPQQPRLMAQPAPPPRPVPRWHPEFGIDLRVEGVALGKTSGSAFNAGLGGVGLSLRYRPVPHFAFDLGVDLLAGTDYNGFQRTEVPISLSGILYVNPKSRVQFYLMAGGNISRAQVRSDLNAPQLQPVDGGSQYGATYTYAGGQGGGGFEFRLSKRVALHLDALGFVRKRIDDGADRSPEFIDPATGQTTNVSAGALVRGGVNFWW